MAALEAFICEPNASGNDFVNRDSTSDPDTFDAQLMDFRACKPEHHLNVIKDKLIGINPVTPIENDLKLGFYSLYV